MIKPYMNFINYDITICDLFCNKGLLLLKCLKNSLYIYTVTIYTYIYIHTYIYIYSCIYTTIYGNCMYTNCFKDILRLEM